MNEAIQFLQSQKTMAIACHSKDDIWIANVYIGVKDDGTIYYISSTDNTHGRLIAENPHVAFSLSWFDSTNHQNRKGIQGKGICRLASMKADIETGVQLHNQNFPEFKKTITLDWIQSNEWNSRVWILQPTFIKHWNDELYGEFGSKEFTF